MCGFVIDYTLWFRYLPNLIEEELEIFAKVDLMLCKEVIEQEPENLSTITGIEKKRIEDIVEMCKKVVKGE